MSSVRRLYMISGSSCKFRRERPAFRFKNFDRSLSENISPLDFSIRNIHPLKYVKDKIDEVVRMYRKFSGWQELLLAQEKVEEAGQTLTRIQEERRKAYAVLFEIQNKLKVIYSQVENTKRGDDLYIHLITEEHKLLKEEKMQQEKFKNVERAERDHFTLYSQLVKNVHEKERVQSEKSKCMSVIGSILGAIIGIIGSSISNSKKMLQLKQLIVESSNSNLESQLNKFMEKNGIAVNVTDNKDFQNKILYGLFNNETSTDNSSDVHKYVNELLLKTNKILLNLEESVQSMKHVQFQIHRLKNINGESYMTVNPQSLEENSHMPDMKSVIAGCCLIICGVIILSRLLS